VKPRQVKCPRRDVTRSFFGYFWSYLDLSFTDGGQETVTSVSFK
jgi:hypothetical protein